MYEHSTPIDVLVAGHVCLDVIPSLGQRGIPREGLRPGSLIEVGAATLSPGGVVSNTGIALHRLGCRVRLVGKIGTDPFGDFVLDLLRREDPGLASGMIRTDAAPTSYTIVLSAPRQDRLFLHCAGCNDIFDASDIPSRPGASARILHFGYPPLMRALLTDGGAAFAARLEHTRQSGCLTSLDMAQPDPTGAARGVDWPSWLSTVLPHVDLFCPSYDEVRFMLGLTTGPRTLDDIRTTAAQLIGLGAGSVLLKLGADGLYLRTRSPGMKAPPDDRWMDRELHAPAYDVSVRGTTGAGDATIAGFLSALSDRCSPDECLTRATAVGSFCVEGDDATSAIAPLASVRRRIADLPPRITPDLGFEGWSAPDAFHVRHGPDDGAAPC